MFCLLPSYHLPWAVLLTTISCDVRKLWIRYSWVFSDMILPYLNITWEKFWPRGHKISLGWYWNRIIILKSKRVAISLEWGIGWSWLTENYHVHVRINDQFLKKALEIGNWVWILTLPLNMLCIHLGNPLKLTHQCSGAGSFLHHKSDVNMK